jgi:hypothetical protein
MCEASSLYRDHHGVSGKFRVGTWAVSLKSDNHFFPCFPGITGPAILGANYYNEFFAYCASACKVIFFGQNRQQKTARRRLFELAVSRGLELHHVAGAGAV